jgi:hypothetical protein
MLTGSPIETAALSLANGAHGRAHFRVKDLDEQPGRFAILTETGTQLGGKQVPASAGDELVMHCGLSCPFDREY